MPRTVLLGTISSVYHDWVPYPVGCLISHCMKNPIIAKDTTFLEPLYKNKWDNNDKYKNTSYFCFCKISKATNHLSIKLLIYKKQTYRLKLVL